MGNEYSTELLNASFKGLETFPLIQKVAKKQQSIIALVGNTSVGKSSLVNYLIGMKISTVGTYATTTMPIIYQFSNDNNIKICMKVPINICNKMNKIIYIDKKIFADYHIYTLYQCSLNNNLNNVYNLIDEMNTFNWDLYNEIKQSTEMELIVIIGNGRFNELFKLVDLPGSDTLNDNSRKYHLKYYSQADTIFFMTTPFDINLEDTYSTYLSISQYNIPSYFVINKIDLCPNMDFNEDIFIKKLNKVFISQLQSEINKKITQLEFSDYASKISITNKFEYRDNIIGTNENGEIIPILKKYYNEIDLSNYEKYLLTLNLAILIHNMIYEKQNKKDKIIDHLLSVKNYDVPEVTKYRILKISIQNKIGMSNIMSVIEKINEQADNNYMESMSKMLLSIYRNIYSTESYDLENDNNVYFPELILKEVESYNGKRKNFIIGTGVTFLVLLGTVLLFTGIGAIASAGLYGAAANGAFWAAIGGGALTAGGLGMAGGMAILATSIILTSVFGLTTMKLLLDRNVPKYKLDNNSINIIKECKNYYSKINDANGKKIYEGSFNYLKYQGKGICYDAANKKFIDGIFDKGYIEKAKIYIDNKLICDVNFNKYTDRLLGSYYVYDVFGKHIKTLEFK